MSSGTGGEGAAWTTDCAKHKGGNFERTPCVAHVMMRRLSSLVRRAGLGVRVGRAPLPSCPCRPPPPLPINQATTPTSRRATKIGPLPLRRSLMASRQTPSGAAEHTLETMASMASIFLGVDFFRTTF